MSIATERHDNPTDYKGPIREQRWLTAHNVGTVAIPSFGFVQFARMAGFNGSGGTSLSDRMVFDVKRPEQYQYGVGDGAVGKNTPWLFAVNGEVPIQPNGTGQVTVDYPAQVFWDSSVGGFPGSGLACGPIADQFSVGASSAGGRGFRCWGVDPTLPLETDQRRRDQVRQGLGANAGLAANPTASRMTRGTVWVVADPLALQVEYASGQLDVSSGEVRIAAGDHLTPWTEIIATERAKVPSDYMTLKPGVWRVSFSATVTIESPLNSSHTALLYLMRDTTATGFYTTAKLLYDTDSTTVDVAEQVIGLDAIVSIPRDADDTAVPIKLKNGSLREIVVKAATMTAHEIAHAEGA